MAKKIHCECCDKVVKKYGARRFCSRCGIYHKDLLQKLGYYKNQVKQLKREKYGAFGGPERIRYKK